MNFTRGIIILTVLLLSVTVSFFMGRILGDELMSGGREQLEPFTIPDDGADASETSLAGGSGSSGYTYEGPTGERFPSTLGTIDAASEDDSGTVLIEPVESSGGSENSGDGGMSDLFSLDEGTSDEGDSQLFRIQVGVFQNKENGDSLVADLRKESFAAYIQQVVYEAGDTMWKVYVGPFKTLEAAQSAAEELRGRSYKCYVQ